MSALIRPVLLVTLGGLGCATPPARAPYTLLSHQGVVASNSPMLGGRLIPSGSPGGVSVPYVVLLFNSGPSFVLRPENITAHVESLVCPAQCRLLDRAGGRNQLPALVDRGQQVRLECSLTLPEDARSLLTVGDRTLDLSVSLASHSEDFAFAYFLRREDAR